MNERLGEFEVDISANTERFQRALVDATRLSQGFARTLTGAFEAIALRGQDLEKVVRSLALNLSKIAFRAAFKPLEAAIGNSFAGIISGVTPFAKGGVAAGSLPVPFARGGVVNSPVGFTFGNGRLGIAGESGAEAILPLSRDSSGNLGVRTAAANGAVTVNLNVTTPDAESFRRSETQIGAMLNRVVSRGRRNL